MCTRLSCTCGWATRLQKHSLVHISIRPQTTTRFGNSHTHNRLPTTGPTVSGLLAAATTTAALTKQNPTSLSFPFSLFYKYESVLVLVSTIRAQIVAAAALLASLFYSITSPPPSPSSSSSFTLCPLFSRCLSYHHLACYSL